MASCQASRSTTKRSRSPSSKACSSSSKADASSSSKVRYRIRKCSSITPSSATGFTPVIEPNPVPDHTPRAGKTPLVAQTPGAEKRTSRWGYPVRVLFVLVVVAVLVRVGVRNAHSLRHVDLQLRPLWLAAAVPFTLLGGLFLPLGWRALLAAYGADLGVAPSLRIWCVSQASRYIPTGVAAFASRIVLTAREGVARSVAAATMLVELG